jgi:hypothetical protein
MDRRSERGPAESLRRRWRRLDRGWKATALGVAVVCAGSLL